MTTNTLNDVSTSTAAPATAHPERLAIYGGQPAVTIRFREGWRQVRLSDLLHISYYAVRDINTHASGGGPIQGFEQKFARLTNRRYALAMNSGTATLHSAYVAVGIKPGDEVIIPSYTFFASAAPILQCGGIPIFCEIDPHTLNADPDDIEHRITPRTRALCVVHVWGNPARMDRMVDIAKRHNLKLIEDCSHAPGATYQGQPVGSWGDIGCFSLQGSKAVSGGEAGIAVTNDPALFDHMLALGHYNRTATDQKANTFTIDNLSFGLKYRPHLYAILLAAGGLKRLPELNRLRRRNYDILCEELAACPALEPIETYPESLRGGLLGFMLKYRAEHAGNWQRGAFVRAAAAEGVPIAVDFYKPLHKTRLFTQGEFAQSGGVMSFYEDWSILPSKCNLTTTERVCEQLVAVQPLTKVPERFVRQCAAALRKVADAAANIQDLRTGE